MLFYLWFVFARILLSGRQALCVAFSGSAAARSYANRVADDIKSAEAEAKSAQTAEKEGNAACDAAKEAEKKAEERAGQLRRK